MKLSIIANPERKRRLSVVCDVAKYLLDHDHEVFVPANLSEAVNGLKKEPQIIDSEEKAVRQSDAVISVGGDGTMLHTAALVHDSGIPVLGINTGKLGFLADTQSEELAEALDQLVTNKWDLDRRFLLQARINNGDVFALNEFLFAKHASVSMTTLEVLIDGQQVNRYWADGLIVATPTGSTAYNLSASGPIIIPETDVMVITPVCPHTLTTRSMVIPADKSVQIRAVPSDQEILFSHDGRVHDEIRPMDVTITKTDFTFNLIKLPGKNYFQTLRSKLMWGLDLREQERGS